MPSTTPAYRILARSAVSVASWVGRVVPAWGEAHRVRQDARDRILHWASTVDRSHPLVWFHAASAGEHLQAGAVRKVLGSRHPCWQFLATWTSPSASRMTTSPRVHLDYLPYDLPSVVGQVLETLRPDLLVFTAADLWPEHATQAASRNIPVALIAGAVRAGSSRLRWPGRSLLAPGYRALSLAAAVDQEDRARLERLGVPPAAIVVTGDPRHDSVLERIAGAKVETQLAPHAQDPALLVAGSTWSTDHRILLRAFALVLPAAPEARLLLVPHEPTDRVFADIRDQARSLGLPVPARTHDPGALSPGGPGGRTPGALLVWDQVGMLAELYRHGSLAWVGGGFRRAGLHSVLEPAGWGMPVAFGARGEVARDARHLIHAGGGVPLVDLHTAPEVLAAWWIRFLRDDAAREAAGAAAQRVVREGAGAAERTATLLEQMVRE